MQLFQLCNFAFSNYFVYIYFDQTKRTPTVALCSPSKNKQSFAFPPIQFSLIKVNIILNLTSDYSENEKLVFFRVIAARSGTRSTAVIHGPTAIIRSPPRGIQLLTKALDKVCTQSYFTALVTGFSLPQKINFAFSSLLGNCIAHVNASKLC